MKEPSDLITSLAQSKARKKPLSDGVVYGKEKVAEKHQDHAEHHGIAEIPGGCCRLHTNSSQRAVGHHQITQHYRLRHYHQIR